MAEAARRIENAENTRLRSTEAAQCYSPGLAGIPAARSKVSYLDGHKGFFKPANAHIKNIFPDVEKPWRTR